MMKNNDESKREINLNDEDALMEDSDNDGETFAEVVNNNESDCNDVDEGDNDTNESNSN